MVTLDSKFFPATINDGFDFSRQIVGGFAVGLQPVVAHCIDGITKLGSLPQHLLCEYLIAIELPPHLWVVRHRTLHPRIHLPLRGDDEAKLRF
ncbi:hypothetical protein BM547_31865 [Pseudomonas aeruginosa]|nr:hypothetical protein HW11_05080 [Pseudomonas aeruginosa]KEA24205.1 hypothetical protein BH79_29020 [Pseudomonas aeruginosa C0324C]OFM76117.1 hypothetical protein HMPREF2666_03255 [Pseudomonas sp. HMSC058C05]OFQ84184.1 hypothetical protein HMPREF2924_32805 [Pseudomonas sp. HMSC063H08]OFT00250.1 hypothetical protein HMPREF3141_01220 [Pseudomonas sp. HMSC16B01]